MENNNLSQGRNGLKIKIQGKRGCDQFNQRLMSRHTYMSNLVLCTGVSISFLSIC